MTLFLYLSLPTRSLTSWGTTSAAGNPQNLQLLCLCSLKKKEHPLLFCTHQNCVKFMHLVGMKYRVRADSVKLVKYYPSNETWNLSSIRCLKWTEEFIDLRHVGPLCVGLLCDDFYLTIFAVTEIKPPVLYFFQYLTLPQVNIFSLSAAFQKSNLQNRTRWKILPARTRLAWKTMLETDLYRLLCDAVYAGWQFSLQSWLGSYGLQNGNSPDQN